VTNQTLPWARIYNIFDPFSPLTPMQIDDLFVERPHSPLARLRYDLGPDHLPQRMLLVGQPFSGKSTELARLAALETLIQHSSGHVRDFIRLFREATVAADIAGSPRIDQSAAEEVFWELRRLYDAQLRPTLRKILEQVAETNRLTDDPDCDRLLYSSIILNYTDHENWYDVHREEIWYLAGGGSTEPTRERGPAYDAFFDALWMLAEKLAADEHGLDETAT